MPTRAACLAWFAVAACSDAQPAQRADARPTTAAVADLASEELSPRLLRRYQAITVPMPDPKTAAVVDLGRVLYYDPRLSASDDVSCNSCHPLDDYGVTDDVVSTGIHGAKGTRNAPSTFHAAGHFRQFWDGRAENVEEQAKGPIINPLEMGMTPDAVVAKLATIAGYRDLFTAAFPGARDPITFENVGRAIGMFERGLVTPGRWDDYLGGNTKALSSLEKQGAKLFSNLGCIVCHTGAYLGGTMFEKAGARRPWPNQNDRGRSAVTGEVADEMMFKVPSLRNVARTAPYFHDGSAATLDEAVRLMARHQLDEELEPDEVVAIVAWLESLTGGLPDAYIARPALPGMP